MIISTEYIKSYFSSKKKNLVTEGDINVFKFEAEKSAAQDIKEKYKYNGDLLDIFANNSGPVVHKWHHYIPIYEKYFSPFRSKETKFLEIGVSKGGSLQMWRKYFGGKAVIFGIDIDPECKKYDGLSGNVRIGSQIDKSFLDDVVNEMGGIDIVLDDGSHHMKHIRSTLDHLFPKLNDGGLYFIEDLHTAYWKNWGGGIKNSANFFNFVRNLCDDMHRWYHGNRLKCSEWAMDCSSLHIHDSIVVIEKHKVYAPTHSQIGQC